jgi:methyl-accepting chemotaxis protein
MTLKWTIETKLLGGAAAMFALTAVLGYSGFRTANKFKDEFDETVDGSVHKVVLADRIGLANSELISAQRGIILAGFAKDKAEIEKYRQTFQQQGEIIQKALDEARLLLKKEEAKTLTADIAASLSQWRPLYEEIVRQTGAGHVAEANHIRKDITGPIYNKITVAAARLQVIETEVLTENKAAVDDQNATSRSIALGLLVLGFVAGSIVVVMVRGISRQIRISVVQLGEGAEQVASAATQVSAASQSLAQGSSEQAASLEETSSSSEEINSMTPQECRELQSSRRIHRSGRSAGGRRPPDTWPDGGFHDRNQHLQRKGLEDHQSHRRDRLPNQYPCFERGGGSCARR